MMMMIYGCAITADLQNGPYSILLHVLPNAHSYCALLPEKFLEEGYCCNSWLCRQPAPENISLAWLKIYMGNLQVASSHLLYTTVQSKPSGFDNQWFSFIQPTKTHVDSQQKRRSRKRSRAEKSRRSSPYISGQILDAASITTKPQVSGKSYLTEIQLQL